MKILGFKLARFAEWRAAVKAESKKVGVWALVCHMVGSAVSIRSDRARWRRRMKVCRKCPIYNRKTRTCRNRFGDGCGCYMPFRAMAKGPCWGRENIDIPKFGWN